MIVSEDHIAILKALIYILPQDYYSASVEEALEIAAKLLENSNGLIVEELERVREEIRIDMSDIVNNSCDYTVGMAKSIEIIDNHIAELMKGEAE